MVSSTHGTAPSLYASLALRGKGSRSGGADCYPHPTCWSSIRAWRQPTWPSSSAYPEGESRQGRVRLLEPPGRPSTSPANWCKRMAGVVIVHVPYKGSGALMPDLLAGRVPMMFENIAIMTAAHQEGGRCGPIAISSAKRTPPASGGSNGGGNRARRIRSPWAGLRCSRRQKTPPEVIRRLNKRRPTRQLRVRPSSRVFAELGAEPLGGSPDQGGRLHQGRAGKNGARSSARRGSSSSKSGWPRALRSRRRSFLLGTDKQVLPGPAVHLAKPGDVARKRQPQLLL